MNTPNPAVRRDTPCNISVSPQSDTVLEAPRQTRVVADVDVLVVGGGPAGVGAALAAGREGARTLLLERHAMLGGMWTAGLVNPVFEFRRKGWIVAEIIQRLETEGAPRSNWSDQAGSDLRTAQGLRSNQLERGAWRPHPHRSTFDVETMTRLLETMMSEARVEFWYHTLMTDAIVEQGRVRGVIVESKAGREAVLAKVVVDCTGDGDVAARAGVPYELGRMADGLLQPMTLMFEIDGLGGYEQKDKPHTYDEMVKAIEENKLSVQLPFGRVNYTPAIILMPRPGSAVVQATHVYRLNGLNPRDVTRGIVDARKQARDLVEVMRHMPGLENVRLLRTAPTLGIRETRRIQGHYRLTMEDLEAGRRFEDAVTFCAFGVDIHEPAPGAGVPSGHGAKMKPYEIPYRCLLPQGVENLLVAGRCISGSHEAHASYRVTGVCMALGQAAGLAAAWAAREPSPPAALLGPQIRQMLVHQGVGFLQ